MVNSAKSSGEKRVTSNGDGPLRRRSADDFQANQPVLERKSCCRAATRGQREPAREPALRHDRQTLHLQSRQKDLIGFLKRHRLGGDQGDGPLDLVVHQKILAGQFTHHGDDLQHVDIAKAAEWSDTPRTFEQKYGAMAGVVKKLGEEFQAKVELAPAL